MEIIYSPKAQEDIDFWKKSGDKTIMNRISTLIKSIEQDPFTGIGKPEALTYDLSKCLSRRITKEHHVVYRMVSDDTGEIISFRYHY